MSNSTKTTNSAANSGSSFSSSLSCERNLDAEIEVANITSANLSAPGVNVNEETTPCSSISSVTITNNVPGTENGMNQEQNTTKLLITNQQLHQEPTSDKIKTDTSKATFEIKKRNVKCVIQITEKDEEQKLSNKTGIPTPLPDIIDDITSSNSFFDDSKQEKGALNDVNKLPGNTTR